MRRSCFSIQWFAGLICCGILLFFRPCFAQTTKVNELQLELKKPHPDTTRVQLLKQLAEAYSSVDPVKKFYYANILKALAEKLHDEKSVTDAYINMGISYGIRSKLDSALYYFTLAYNRAEKAKYLLGMGRSLADIGYAYDRINDRKESISNYFQALAIFKKVKYDKGTIQCYTNIGSIYFDLQQFKLAQTYFSQCLKANIATKSEAGIAGSLYSLGNCAAALDSNDKAMGYFTKSLAIREKLGDVNGTGLAKRGIGIVYRHQKKYDLSLRYLKDGLKDIQSLQDKYEESAILVEMADTYLAIHDYANAEKCATQSLSIGQAIKSKSTVSESYQRLVKVYKGRHDLPKAFKYLSEYVAVEDSILEGQAVKDVTMIEFGRIRSENAVLSKDNRIIASKNTDYLTRLNQYTNIIVVIVVVLASVMMLLIVLYYRNLEKQATNKLLLKQKEEIASINKELEMLNEELNTQMELTNAQNIELERLNGVKNKFFSIVSHDLRSPLSTLQTLFAIYREGEIEEEELNALLSRMEYAILSTSTFLDNLLEWSKSQMEGIVINPTDFNISELISENITLYETKMDMKDLKLINLAHEPVMANADRNMINLVVRNLLSNSVKFCNPGDEIIFNAEVKDDKAIFSIRDTGPGISEADRDKIFNLEHTLSIGTQGEKGNHLGLILCRDMVIQNGGNIWFESKEGEGTTFWVELSAAS